MPVFMGADSIDTFTFSDINNDKQKDIVVTDSSKTLAAALSKKDGTYIDV